MTISMNVLYELSNKISTFAKNTVEKFNQPNKESYWNKFIKRFYKKEDNDTQKNIHIVMLYLIPLLMMFSNIFIFLICFDVLIETLKRLSQYLEETIELKLLNKWISICSIIIYIYCLDYLMTYNFVIFNGIGKILKYYFYYQLLSNELFFDTFSNYTLSCFNNNKWGVIYIHKHYVDISNKIKSLYKK